LSVVFEVLAVKSITLKLSDLAIFSTFDIIGVPSILQWRGFTWWGPGQGVWGGSPHYGPGAKPR